MSIEMIDFDDIPEEEIKPGVRTVNITAKVEEDVRDMFQKISKRERYNMSELSSKLITDYVKDYIERYKQGKDKE